MKLATKYTRIQIWHIRHLFSDQSVADGIIRGDRELSGDEMDLLDVAIRSADIEKQKGK